MRYTWVLCNTYTDYKTTGQRDTTQLSERKLARVIYNYQPGHNTMFNLRLWLWPWTDLGQT